jgi:hypothetical protein
MSALPDGIALPGCAGRKGSRISSLGYALLPALSSWLGDIPPSMIAIIEEHHCVRQCILVQDRMARESIRLWFSMGPPVPHFGLRRKITRVLPILRRKGYNVNNRYSGPSRIGITVRGILFIQSRGSVYHDGEPNGLTSKRCLREPAHQAATLCSP